MCVNLARSCSGSSGIRMVAAICELSESVTIQTVVWTNLQQFVGGYMVDLTKSQNWQNLGIGACAEMGACLGGNTSQINALTIDDAFQRRQFSAACYQLGQSVLKIGSVPVERVGQGEVGGCTLWLAVHGNGCSCLQKNPAWSMPGRPFVGFLAQTGVENAPFTLQGLHFRQLFVQRSILWSEGPDY